MHSEKRLQDKIRAGAEFLDGAFPGWHRWIDLDRLRMDEEWFDAEEDDCGCIGAQINAHETGHAGNYEAFAEGINKPASLGFMWLGLQHSLFTDGTADRLWESEVTSRIHT